MKFFKHIIIYVSIFTLLAVTLLGLYPQKVYAEVPSSQRAVAHTGTWTGYEFDYSRFGKYWTIEDSTGIPTSTIDHPIFFFAHEGEFVTLGDADKRLIENLDIQIFIHELGIIWNPTTLIDGYRSLFTIMAKKDVTSNSFIQGAIYGTGGTFLGYALNDITNCYYGGTVNDNTPIEIPTIIPDNLYKFHQYYIGENEEEPDYITVTPPDYNFIRNHINIDQNDNQDDTNSSLANLQTLLNNNDNLYRLAFYSTTLTSDLDYVQFGGSTLNYSVVSLYNDFHYIATNNNTNWTNFSNYFDLTKDNNNVSYTDFIEKGISNENVTIEYSIYNASNNQVTSFNLYNLKTNSLNSTYTYNTNILGQGSPNSQRVVYNMMAGKPYTIYKSSNVYNNIKSNNYTNNYYYGSNYYDYSINNDNSTTINADQVGDNTTINGDIYDDCTTNFNEYTDNHDNIDNSVITEDNDTIINIYYPESDHDPDPVPDPDPDPDDPEGILDAILEALRRFFSIIGRLLGTVLAGLLEVIDTLLESIAGIMENLTGVTDFISALFSWIPSPVPQILGVGISICILAAIIKFIRG